MTRFGFTLMAGAVLLFGAGAAYAQCSPGIPCTDYEIDTGANDAQRGDAKTCNGDVMNQMIARATLEARRENVLNQTHIRKADSVLEYSCFDQLANLVPEKAAPLFSETTAFQYRNVDLNIRYAEAADGSMVNNPSSVMLNTFMGSGHMKPNIQKVVTQPALSYINSNFSHEYLGGDAGVDFSPGGGGYNCSDMNSVWQIAKCRNLPDAPFPSFEDLVDNDPRTLPEACPDGTGITQDIIDVAMNEAPGFEYAGFDVMEVKWEMFEVDGTSGESCPADPIPVGLTMKYYEGQQVAPNPATNPAGIDMTVTEYEEHVCPNPGCWYDGDSGECKE